MARCSGEQHRLSDRFQPGVLGIPVRDRYPLPRHNERNGAENDAVSGPGAASRAAEPRQRFYVCDFELAACQLLNRVEFCPPPCTSCFPRLRQM